MRGSSYQGNPAQPTKTGGGTGGMDMNTLLGMFNSQAAGQSQPQESFSNKMQDAGYTYQPSQAPMAESQGVPSSSGGLGRYQSMAKGGQS